MDPVHRTVETEHDSAVSASRAGTCLPRHRAKPTRENDEQYDIRNYASMIAIFRRFYYDVRTRFG
jgi:hypothetical protein